MIDISHTVVPKSNQTNADDFLVGPRTITITKVSLTNNPEQPVAVSYEGDEGKPFLPCKTVRRIMIACWSEDASKYVGKSMTLYRDAEVTFGKDTVGGIRVSHMSDLNGPKPLTLRKTKQTVKNYIIQPLAVQQKEKVGDPDLLKNAARTSAENGMFAFKQFWSNLNVAEQKIIAPIKDDLKTIATEADAANIDHEPEGDVFND